VPPMPPQPASRLTSSSSVPTLAQQRRAKHPESRHSCGGMVGATRLPQGPSGGKDNAGKLRRSSTGSMGNLGRRQSVQAQHAYDMSSWHCLHSVPQIVVISSRPLEAETYLARRHSMATTSSDQKCLGTQPDVTETTGEFHGNGHEKLRPTPQAARQHVATSTWTPADVQRPCHHERACCLTKGSCPPSEALQCTVEEPSQGFLQTSRGEMRSASSQTTLTSTVEVEQARLAVHPQQLQEDGMAKKESRSSMRPDCDLRPPRRSAPAGCLPSSAGERRRRRSSVVSAQSLTANLSSIIADADLSFCERPGPLIPPNNHGWDWPLSRQEKKARVVMLDRNMLLADQSALLEQMHELCVEFGTTECLDSPTGFDSDAGSTSCL